MRAARATPSRLAPIALAVGLCTACSAAGTGDTVGAVAPTPASTTTASTSAPAPTTSEPVSASTSVASVPAALSFSATTVDGAAFTGAELAGTRTVLWFWAPWCTVCARAAAGVKAAAATLAPDVRVVGVAGLSSDAADMRRFVDRGGLQSMTTLADTGGDVYARFGVTQQDTFVLIAPDGTVSKHPAYSQDVDLVALARQTFG
jgi:peroxiredoxin